MNGNKPVDLLELARQAGVAQAREHALEARRDSVQLVTFEHNRDPNRELPVGRHPATNRVVFPDMKRQGAGIKPGETYFCDLIEYHPPAGPSVYYANPITKVDASYLFDLRPEHVDKLVEVLLRSAQGKLLEQARAQIRLSAEQDTKHQISALAAEKEAARLENDRLKLEIEKLRQLVVVGSNGDQATRQSPVEPRSSATTRAISTRSHTHIADSQTSAVTGVVNRPAADLLSSPLLSDGRYFVHVSPNRQKLFIHPHPEGNLRAENSSLSVPSLSILRPFDGGEILEVSADPRVGGLSMSLAGTRHEV